MPMQPGEKPFSTSDAILAITLFLSGCEPCDPLQPCTNLFDVEILKNLGYSGETLGEAANQAWKDQKKGHVQFHIRMTERCLELIKAHRDQMDRIEKGDGTSFQMLCGLQSEFTAGAMAVDELIMRMACVTLRTRGQFVNLYKQMIPLLRIPSKGRSKIEDGPNNSRVVKKPGFRVVSLNATEKTKEHLKL